MSEEAEDIPPPRETSKLFGHAAAEQALLSAYKSGRVPHAWLIGGEPGIGKATLAYRFARFVQAHPDPAAPDVQQATSLAVDPDNRVARRIAAQAQGDLLTLERVMNEQTGKLYTVIRVDDVRRTVAFFGSTAGEGGWRIAIVDAVDDLAREGANALLKVLEEPPERALLLLVSHAPGRELPTIRSRCRRLLLRPLAPEDVARAVATASGRAADDAQVTEAVAAADGSVARALALLDGATLALRQRVLESDGATARSRPARAACVGRRPRRQRSAHAGGLHGPGERLAVGAAGGAGAAADGATWLRPGKASTAPRAMPRPITSNASRWCLRYSARSPTRRADERRRIDATAACFLQRRFTANVS